MPAEHAIHNLDRTLLPAFRAIMRYWFILRYRVIGLSGYRVIGLSLSISRPISLSDVKSDISPFILLSSRRISLFTSNVSLIRRQMK